MFLTQAKKTYQEKGGRATSAKSPVNFLRDVQDGLSSGSLSGCCRAKFISTVASSMFLHKSYPTKEEYSHVAQVIVKVYTFMRLGGGTGHVSSSQSHNGQLCSHISLCHRIT